MRLLTLNTHSLVEPDYEAKRKFFVDFIAKEQPDVFALQEVNPRSDSLRHIGVGRLPKHAYTVDMPLHTGLSVASGVGQNFVRCTELSITCLYVFAIAARRGAAYTEFRKSGVG